LCLTVKKFDLLNIKVKKKLLNDDENDLTEEELENIFKRKLLQHCKFLDEELFSKEPQNLDCCATEYFVRKAMNLCSDNYDD
jgi:hypothetical protein